jgi:phage-related protein
MRMAPVTHKPLQFMGTSHDDLKAFPDEARRDAGFNLDFVQRGFDPEKLEADEDRRRGR